MSAALDNHRIAYEGNSVYDFDNHILLNWYAKRIVELTAGAGSLLELGLGHGFSAKVFDGRFREYTILEGSAAIIDLFRKNNPGCGARIVQTYFEEFQSSQKFDVIVMGFILEHVDDPVLVLKHYRSLLAPGGRLFASVPNAHTMNRRLGHLAGLLPDMQTLSQNDLDLGHKRFYTVDSFRADLAAAGYTGARIEGIYLKPFTTSQIMSLKLDQKIIEALCELGTGYPELCCGLLAEVGGGAD